MSMVSKLKVMKPFDWDTFIDDNNLDMAKLMEVTSFSRSGALAAVNKGHIKMNKLREIQETYPDVEKYLKK